MASLVEPKPDTMFYILAIMFVGIGVGYLLRRWCGVEHVSTSTTITIMILLFVMGCEIGNNETLMSNLPTLGGEAAVIAIAATLGSVVAAKIVYNRFFKTKTDK